MGLFPEKQIDFPRPLELDEHRSKCGAIMWLFLNWGAVLHLSRSSLYNLA